MNKKILLIDKDPAVIDVITLILESEGYEMYVAKKPFDKNEVNEVMPDLILMHNGINNEGSSICKELKLDPELRSIPLILTSTNPNIAEISKQNGADNFLIKPFDINELCKLIISTMNKSQ
ncbi:PleD family two-component system response regulator [Pedobacter antarcticus]|uniref:response regulator n=1 Tax=Pedobacter antarcticus TaxID=34086 RepID=UPI00292F96F5|nr:response regulator [Pedobacter antarcticus]